MSQLANPRFSDLSPECAINAPEVVPGKALTKGQLVDLLSRVADLPKGSVTKVLDGLVSVAKSELHLGPGVFKVPGLVSLKVKEKPARKETQRVNPFTKEPMVVAAKPATKAVKATVPASLQPDCGGTSETATLTP